MWSKLDIRNLINSTKTEYSISKDRTLLLKASILKGLYLALDGEKGIPLPNKYDAIVLYSKIIFRYKLKHSNKERAYSTLYKSLRNCGKVPEYYLNNKIPESNSDLAELLSILIVYDYTDDIIINQTSIYVITLNIMEEMER